MAKYNGHRNWNHWNVSIMIGNDENLYRLAISLMRQYRTKNEAAAAMLGYLPPTTPDGAPCSLSAVRAALVGLT